MVVCLKAGRQGGNPLVVINDSTVAVQISTVAIGHVTTSNLLKQTCQRVLRLGGWGHVPVFGYRGLVWGVGRLGYQSSAGVF
jgi:hypothetical protein